jgi:hypothetical protein
MQAPTEVRLTPEAPAAPPVVDTANIQGDASTVEVKPGTIPAATKTEQRAEWLPEGIADGPALAAAYAELRKKMSTEGAPKVETPAATTETTTPAASKTAEPTPEQKAAAQALTETLTKAAGDEATLKAAIEWAKVNLSEADRVAFDAACDTGNAGVQAMAMNNVMSAYREAVPVEPNLIRGETSPAAPAVPPYGSRQEMMRDMSSAAYKSGDPAFHAKVRARIAVSTIL